MGINMNGVHIGVGIELSFKTLDVLLNRIACGPLLTDIVQIQIIQHTFQLFPLIFSAGKKPIPLKTRGIALGLKENVSYVKEERSIHPNDLVLIYSDGISEAMNARKEEFGDKRLQEIVQHNSGDSASKLIDKIIAAANLHFGDASQNDDMTIIIIKRKR